MLIVDRNESFKFLFNRWINFTRKSFYLCSTHFTIIFINSSVKNLCTSNAHKSPLKTGAQKRKRIPMKNTTNIFESSNKNGTNIECSGLNNTK